MVAAPWLSRGAVDQIEVLLARCGPYLPIVARNVVANMRSAGVYSHAVYREHFAQLGSHFAGALHALRCAGRRGDQDVDRCLASVVAERIELDESVARLREAAAHGRGAILMGPHIANYLLNLAGLNQRVPLTVYLRHSKDARRRAAKERWYRASGVGWISEPASAGGSLGRLGRMAGALREGRTLFITPDLPQKRGDGTPVRFFQREIYLPAGPAVLALRTGAPLFLLLARQAGNRQRLVVSAPFVTERSGRALSGWRTAIRQRVQWFASSFEQFLVEQTPLWYLWGDKRWTGVFRGDPRYVRPLTQEGTHTPTSKSTNVVGVV